jgi:hypothetical protein
MDKGFKETTEKDLANKMYEAEDYTSTDWMAQGLAITHEQVSDYYMEGTVGAVDDRDSDEDQQIPRKG